MVVCVTRWIKQICPCVLFQECGIVNADGAAAAAAGDGQEAGDAGHRVLVFAQLRSLLDIVARDLLQPAGVPFLRLDGG